MLIVDAAAIGAVRHGTDAISRIYRGAELVWQGNAPRLPAAYQEVEYIEFPEGCSLDLGMMNLNRYKYVVDAQILSTLNVNRAVFGGYRAVGTNDFAQFCVNSAVAGWIFQWGSGYNSAGTKDNERHIFTADIPNKKFGVDGTLWEASTNGATNGTSPLYLCGCHDSGGTIARRTSMRAWSFKRFPAGSETPDRDLVPCYRKADGVVGMYDMVEGTFQVKAAKATGAIKAGPEV